jgi:hypothetical protein
MLTLRQLLVASGNGSDALHASTLLAQFSPRPLSVRSVITAIEKQRIVLIVELISTKVLALPDVKTVPDVLRVGATPAGRPSAEEFLAFSRELREYNLSLRLLTKDLRYAAIVGEVPELVNAPAGVVNDGNFITVKDKYSGASSIGGGIATFGAGMFAIGTLPTPASPALLIIGSAAFGLGAGIMIGAGVLDMMQGTPPPPKAHSPQSSSTPNEAGPDGPDGLDTPQGDNLEVPNAVALGTPPDGLETDGMLQQLGDFAVDFTVDMALSDLPIGFDPANGHGLPGFPDLGGDQEGSGGPGGGDTGFYPVG